MALKFKTRKANRSLIFLSFSSNRKRQHVSVKLITRNKTAAETGTKALSPKVGVEQTLSRLAQKLRKLWRMNAAVVEIIIDVLLRQGYVVSAFSFVTAQLDREASSPKAKPCFPIYNCNLVEVP